MVVPLLPAFLVTLGAGAAFIGVIEGVAEGTSALLKYASGHWADRARRLLPPALAGCALAACARPFLAIARAPWQVLAIRSNDTATTEIYTLSLTSFPISVVAVSLDRKRTCLNSMNRILSYSAFSLQKNT